MSHTTTSLDFGYYPVAYDMNRGPIAIITLPNLLESVADVEANENVRGDWVYVPGQRRVFALPKTHRIEVAQANDQDRAAFLVQCFGFLVGMRMSTMEAGFLDATPIKPGKLVDLVVGGEVLVKAVEHADAFWSLHKNSARIVKALAGTIHMLMLAQEPTLLGFEQFLLLYTAIDSCYFVYQGRPTSKKAKGHGERLALLCDELGTTTPPWLSDVVAERNRAIHEGLFLGEPLGFNTFGGGSQLPPETPLQLSALLCRFVVSLLGIPATRYVASRVDTRQNYKLSL